MSPSRKPKPGGTPTGVRVHRIAPGNPEWLARMSASKIAAVVGLSQWESRFSLYHRMTGILPPEPDDDIKRRGHYLEPAIAAWFADQHPDCDIQETGTYLHPERDWQAATPDRLVAHTDGRIELLQCKSAASGDEQWGPADTDEIPVGYRAQVMWEMDTVGVDTCHVAVMLPYLEFRAYLVRYDADEAAFLRREGRRFLDEIEQRIRPNIDSHSATYQTLRELHPDIEPTTVELPAEIAMRYAQACADEAAAKADKQHASSLVLDHMGTARKATYLDQTVARRQVKTADGSIPYLVAARGVAHLVEQSSAA